MAEPAPLRGPRIRRASIPAEANLLVRGAERDRSVTRHQAARFRRRFPEWGRFGLSAFYASDDVEIEDLAANQLDRYRTILVFDVADLVAAGFEVVPTFRTPHVTIAFAGDLNERVATLEALEVARRTNPYNVDESSVDDQEEGDR